MKKLIATFIVVICWHPKIYLHPFTAAIIIFSCYTLHSYIENKNILKKLQLKYSKQEEIMKEIYFQCISTY